MHPLLISPTRITLYLAAWVPVACLLALALVVTGGLHWGEASALAGPLILFLGVACLAPWYACRMLPLGMSRIPALLTNHVGAAIVTGGLWALIAKWVAEGLTHLYPGLYTRFSPQLPALFGEGVLVYILAVALHYIILSIQASRESIQREQEARVLVRESQLKALKAQINPHFLFNSLNSISALATVDGVRARDMCIRLSEFLRSTLRLGEQESISLKEELALAMAYLGVEQVRFGARLRVEQHIDPACENCMVPSLVLQPLVENAVKHGIAGLVEGGTIRLKAEVDDEYLRVRVENEFDPDAPVPRKSGLGLANVRDRLKTRYEEQARLDTSINEDCYAVEVTLPCAIEAGKGASHAGAA
jgi:two-component system sensor histidine kinase AlgZ